MNHLPRPARPPYASGQGCPALVHLSSMSDSFQQILRMGQQVQARLSQLQSELGQRTVSSSSGGGMVTVTADGRGKIRSVRIDPAVVDAQDVEMLEDLVLAAVSSALRAAREAAAAEAPMAGLPNLGNLGGIFGNK